MQNIVLVLLQYDAQKLRWRGKREVFNGWTRAKSRDDREVGKAQYRYLFIVYEIFCVRVRPHFDSWC